MPKAALVAVFVVFVIIIPRLLSLTLMHLQLLRLDATCIHRERILARFTYHSSRWRTSYAELANPQNPFEKILAPKAMFIAICPANLHFTELVRWVVSGRGVHVWAFTSFHRVTVSIARHAHTFYYLVPAPGAECSATSARIYKL